VTNRDNLKFINYPLLVDNIQATTGVMFLTNAMIIGHGNKEYPLIEKLHKEGNNVHFMINGNDKDKVLFPGAKEVINLLDNPAIYNYIKENNIQLTIVEDKELLKRGIVDYLVNKNVNVIGPSQESAVIGTDKMYTMVLMREAGVPHPHFSTANESTHALLNAYSMLDKSGGIVIKYPYHTDGITSFICKDEQCVDYAIDEIFDEEKYEKKEVLIEELLEGEKISILTLFDGENIIPLTYARRHDIQTNAENPHKKITVYEDNYKINKSTQKRIMNEIIYPMGDYIVKTGLSYVGALRANIVLTKDGPVATEFDNTFGDVAQSLGRDINLYKVLYDCINKTVKLPKQEITNYRDTDTKMIPPNGKIEPSILPELNIVNRK
jgi:phosphoribosylamine--glycine ligase